MKKGTAIALKPCPQGTHHLNFIQSVLHYINYNLLLDLRIPTPDSVLHQWHPYLQPGTDLPSPQE